MKINDNLYVCEWCGENIEHTKYKSTGGPNPMKGNMPGKNSVTSTLKCPNPKCNRNVSQRRVGGLK